MIISLKKTFSFGGAGEEMEIQKIPQNANRLSGEAHLSGLEFNANITSSRWGTTVIEQGDERSGRYRLGTG
ncbi:MAG: hypothetical protein O7E52_02720 [Candidatus Poribacteria bacterium]|nr:hypothetical protein [Candidatus Poribacteria bacterium]